MELIRKHRLLLQSSSELDYALDASSMLQREISRLGCMKFGLLNPG